MELINDDVRSLEWRLRAYENALEWINSDEYERVNEEYKSYHENLYGESVELGLCYYFNKYLFLTEVYFEFKDIFPELDDLRTTEVYSPYIAFTKEERIEILFEAIEVIKTKISDYELA